MRRWAAWLIAFTLVGLPLIIYLLPIEVGDYNTRWGAWAVINVIAIGGWYQWDKRHPDAH